MKIVRYILIGLVVLVAGAQAIRPERTNPPASNPLAIGDAQVESILRRSCFDCHSNETRWPWYSNIAPMSWQIAEHVEHGRVQVNFSDWNEEKAAERLDEICEETRDGAMPLNGYLLIHRDANLNTEDVNTLCAWSGARLAASGGPTETKESSHED